VPFSQIVEKLRNERLFGTFHPKSVKVKDKEERFVFVLESEKINISNQVDVN
jgi:hypothetical protein